MSPRIVTCRPWIRPLCSRMVKASSRAWVGCSWAPSPALITLALRKRDRKWGAPVGVWRMMMMSALRASRLRAVSLSVSPFLNEEASAEKLITSAVSRCAASSKLMRVRVDGSTNRLTTVLPRNAGTFLIARSPTALNARAVSSTVATSSAVSDSMSSRSLRVQVMKVRCSCLFNHRFVFGVAHFLQAHDHAFAERRRNVFADEVRFDRQLAMAAIDEHGELNPLRPAEIVERIHRRANRAAFEEDVVDEHHGLAGDVEGNHG